MAQIDMSGFLLSQAWNAPHALVYLVGIVLAVVFWRKHQEVSLLCLFAFLLLLGGLVAGAAAQYWMMANRGGGPEFLRVTSVLHGGRILFSVLAWGMLLLALFGWRYPRTGEGKPPQDPYGDYGGGTGPTRF